MPIDTTITYWRDEFDYFEPASFIGRVDPNVWIQQVIGSADEVSPILNFPYFEPTLADSHPNAYNFVYCPGAPHGLGSYTHAVAWWQLLAAFNSDIQRAFTTVEMDTSTSGSNLYVEAVIHFPEDDTSLGVTYALRDSADIPQPGGRYPVALWFANTNDSIIAVDCPAETTHAQGPLFFECPELWLPGSGNGGRVPMTSVGGDTFAVTISRPASGHYKAIFVQVWEEIFPNESGPTRVRGHGVASSLPIIVEP